MNHRVRILAGEGLRKPFCKERLLASLGTEGHRVAVVGDRLAMDVVLGRLLGGVSVLVLPWRTDNEQPGLAAARFIEHLAWKHLLGTQLMPHKNEVIKKLQVMTRFP